MNNIEIIFLLMMMAGLFYGILIIAFTIGWTRLKQAAPGGRQHLISVVVAMRNEEIHVANLIHALYQQDYPAEWYELIFVNDHSGDGTVERIREHDRENRVVLLHLEEGQKGKKSALSKGIHHARGRYIAITDADCIPGRGWLSSIAEACQEDRHKMIAGPVVIRERRTLLNQFQAMELLSLVGSGAGAIGMGSPLMCNAANLAFDKQAFFDVGGYQGNDHIPGGDDMFLLQKFKKTFSGRAVTFLKDQRAIIPTAGSSGINAFIRQRIRWVAKSPAYRDPLIIITAILVFLLNFSILASFIAGFFLPRFFSIGILMLIYKLMIDFKLLWKVSGFTRQRFLMKYYLLFQLIYVPFTAIIAIAGNLAGYRWKGRS